MTSKNITPDYPHFLKLKRARKPDIKPGTIFYFSINPGVYMWGKVVRVLIREKLLVYLYKYETKSVDNIPELSYDDLITAPLYLYDSFWTGGEFVTKAYSSLSKEEEERIHYFKDISYKGEKINPDGSYYSLVNKMHFPEAFSDEYNNPIADKKIIDNAKYVGSSGLRNIFAIAEDIVESLKEIKQGKEYLITPQSYQDPSTLTFPKQTKEPKTKEPTQIKIEISNKDINNPEMDMLTLEELFEDVVGKKPFTDKYDELNQEPITIILETTNKIEAKKIIKQIMDKATFTNPETNKEQKLFKKYEVLEVDNDEIKLPSFK